MKKLQPRHWWNLPGRTNQKMLYFRWRWSRWIHWRRGCANHQIKAFRAFRTACCRSRQLVDFPLEALSVKIRESNLPSDSGSRVGRSCRLVSLTILSCGMRAPLKKTALAFLFLARFCIFWFVYLHACSERLVRWPQRFSWYSSCDLLHWMSILDTIEYACEAVRD